MLPGPTIPDEAAGLTPTEAAAIFADLDSPSEAGSTTLDVSALAGVVFEPEVAQPRQPVRTMAIRST